MIAYKTNDFERVNLSSKRYNVKIVQNRRNYNLFFATHALKIVITIIENKKGFSLDLCQYIVKITKLLTVLRYYTKRRI